MATSMPPSLSTSISSPAPNATITTTAPFPNGATPATASSAPTAKWTDEQWRIDAACASLGPAETALFFSEVLSEVAAAKRICAQCPVLAPCLEGAITRAEPCGVWGGQLFENGRVLMQKRRRGRPPKVARADDELPVVAVPVHLADRLPLAG